VPAAAFPLTDRRLAGLSETFVEKFFSHALVDNPKLGFFLSISEGDRVVLSSALFLNSETSNRCRGLRLPSQVTDRGVAPVVLPQVGPPPIA